MDKEKITNDFLQHLLDILKQQQRHGGKLVYIEKGKYPELESYNDFKVTSQFGLQWDENMIEKYAGQDSYAMRREK